ncbi:UDP-N-acetylglucosamine transferase subunit alg13 [Penicillium taxi]|uniref:UDP-N-acetylglucosamine transferase subunit alg13 n=1 Tax=Penicillium taxi TaxID=168475 RepID=UPI002545162A|nr:UDP-N-acetylglucosamine transferase subunit alg13 [Penicillium taxi]KAJ5898920.1 UDP-N-acetylglucosamine transferase subunit alg13 [Penicillium taxi]
MAVNMDEDQVTKSFGTNTMQKFINSKDHMTNEEVVTDLNMIADMHRKTKSTSTRTCFVTVGASASFKPLLRYVLSEPFFRQLVLSDFTHLIVQYGHDGESLWEQFLNDNPTDSETLHGLALGGFDFKPSLAPYMELVTADDEQHRKLGIVISHAGTGTILDALHFGLNMIIVPNNNLADNHQEELAMMLYRIGYACPVNIDDIHNLMYHWDKFCDQDPTDFEDAEGYYQPSAEADALMRERFLVVD